MLKAGRGRQLIGCALVVTAFSLVQATAASAQERAGTFACKGTVLRVGANETSVANPQFSPCVTDANDLTNSTIPLGGGNFVQAILLEARTQSNPSPTAVGTEPFRGHGGGAQAGVAGVGIKIGTLTIRTGVLRSRANVVCLTYAPPLGPGSPPVMSVLPSDVVNIKINNTELAVSNPVTLPLLGVGTLYLNRTIRTSNALTRRALELDRPGTAGDIVVGESRVGFAGNPCTT